MKKSLIYILISILLISTVFAEDVNVYFFYGDGCPHCAEAEPFLEKMVEKYPDVNLHSYETWKNTDNSDLFIKMSSACGTDVIGVPTIFIGHEAIIGYDNDENKGREIEEAIINYDGVDLMKNIGDNLTTCPNDKKDIDTVITLPLIGTIDTTRISLPLFTIIIGLLDGFNPCAMWVLMFLLTLLVYTKSRKRMFMIGGTFILISGLVYYFFMAAWLNLYLIIGFLPILRFLVGGFAVIFGAINMKELFFFKKGPSLTISKKAKPKLFKKMRALINEKSIFVSLIGVAVLAFTVNSVELLCTAGFPAIYTNILTINNLSSVQYYLYIGLYILMYMLDDFIVFTIAVYTLSSKKLTENQGKWLKFVSGAMLFILGLLLILKPNLLMLG